MAQPWAIKFYNSGAWIKCRAAYSRSVFGLCERCGEAGIEVHHQIYLTPDNIDDPEVALSWDNLELLCAACHNKEHFGGTEGSVRDDVAFDANGDLVARG